MIILMMSQIILFFWVTKIVYRSFSQTSNFRHTLFLPLSTILIKEHTWRTLHEGKFQESTYVRLVYCIFFDTNDHVFTLLSEILYLIVPHPIELTLCVLEDNERGPTPRHSLNFFALFH